MKSHFYASLDGLKLHYLFWPNQQKQHNSCFLLLHGFTNGAYVWNSLAPKLQAYGDVIAIDFRGHGNSEWDSEEKYSQYQLLEDVYQLIQQLPYQQLHLVGHSLGARVAMLMTTRKAITPASFTIIDTGPEVRASGVNKVRRDSENTPKSFSSIESYKNYLQSIYLFGQTDKIQLLAENGLKEAQGQLTAKTDPAFTSALWQPDSQQGNSDDLRHQLKNELWQALSQLQSPSLIIKGQVSAILSKSVAEKMVFKVIPNAQLKIIRNAGHAVMIDNPTELEAAICEFIQQLTVEI